MGVTFNLEQVYHFPKINAPMDLFDHQLNQIVAAEAPLAARMRPRTLDEFVGQDAIVGPGRLLRRAIQADQLSSIIFYGPPGTGKTTLAQIIANSTLAHFIAINAVLAGVKDIREAIDKAQELRKLYNKRTILFVDEVHRFSKSQQDALLPWVENGTVILIGATTENPYFEVNKALVSRSRLFQLKPLDAEDLKEVIHQAITDRERGYGNQSIEIEPEAIEHLVNIANGDARTLLNALELAVLTTPANAENVIEITVAIAEESIQKRAVLYDKEGDAHFDSISAFIKSLRGSDADAALYWLAKMVYAGEDPRFIFRRMLIFAGEDVGMADPQAIGVVNACAQGFDRVGLPEGRYPLAQAALYLATCAKSNSIMGFFDALAAIEQEREAEVPTHLRDANRDKEGFGHGAGYLYPHAYRDHWVEQQYLPKSLQGQVFYQPSDQGYEGQIRDRVSRQREAQLAALIDGSAAEIPERLTQGPANASLDRWLSRSLSQAGAQLATVRDRLFDRANPQRHHLILDLNAGSGLLTWEALRRVPEGGVYACVADPLQAQALREQAAALPELLRPIVRQTQIEALDLPADLRFDAIVGRNALTKVADKAQAIRSLRPWLQPQGQIILAESIPKQAQRLYNLLPETSLKTALKKALRNAEDAIYNDRNNPMVNWDIAELQQYFDQANFATSTTVESLESRSVINVQLLDRWFTTISDPTAPSYRDRLALVLKPDDIATIETTFRRHLLNQTVTWKTTIAFVTASLRPETGTNPSPQTAAVSKTPAV
jgi:putative ATPase